MTLISLHKTLNHFFPLQALIYTQALMGVGGGGVYSLCSFQKTNGIILFVRGNTVLDFLGPN